MAEFDSDLIIPEQVKQTIGRLIVVIAAEADPAKKIHYTSSLISEIKSALKIIIRHWKLESTDKLLWDCIKTMILSDISDGLEYQKALATIQELHRKFDPAISRDKNGHAISKEAEVKAYMTLQDYYTVVSCRNRWQMANNIYFTNNDSWQYSNAMLADIHDVLIDIANKHNMIIIPKNSFFSIDEFNNYGAFKAIPKEGQ
jgi:hypothetical protein